MHLFKLQLIFIKVAVKQPFAWSGITLYRKFIYFNLDTSLSQYKLTTKMHWRDQWGFPSLSGENKTGSLALQISGHRCCKIWHRKKRQWQKQHQCHTHFGSEHFCPNLEWWAGSTHESRHPTPCSHTALCSWLQHNPNLFCPRAMTISTGNIRGAPLASQSIHREEVSSTQVHPLSLGLERQLCAAESFPHGQSGSKGEPPCSAKNSPALPESTLPTLSFQSSQLHAFHKWAQLPHSF